MEPEASDLPEDDIDWDSYPDFPLWDNDDVEVIRQDTPAVKEKMYSNLDPLDNTLLGKGVPNFVLDPGSVKNFPPLATPEQLEAMQRYYMGEQRIRPPIVREIPDMSAGSQSVFFEGAGIKKGFDKEAAWIQTHSGRRFCPTSPNPDAIVIQDVAHALAMQCRFSGHCRKFYCVTPDTKILTSNLTWVPAGNLRTFDGLVGFDEYPVKVFDNNRNRRKMRYANVMSTGLIKRHVWALHLSDGTVLKSSDEHPWLVSAKKSRNQKWETTQEIVAAVGAGRQRFILKFLEPWDNRRNPEVEYLSGIIDGEGTINCDRKGFIISIAQKPGPVLDKIKTALNNNGFKYGEYPHKSGVHNLQILGTWHDKLKFLSITNSVRLLDKYKEHLRNESWRKEFDSITMLTVEKVEDLGIQDVVALETSSRTYFAEGFGAHNSVAQHSVLVSHICDSQDALWGLLHDASEAYLVDVPRPLKRSGKLQGYIEFEAKMQEAVCRRFGLPLKEPPSVKRADQALLATEARDLMSPLHPDWDWPIEPLPFLIEPWEHQRAKDMFMKRFFELTGSPHGYEHYLHYKDQL